MFRGEVRREARRDTETGHRRGVDDVADALLLHDRQERTDAVHHSEQVDVDDSMPQFDRVGPRITEAADPRVVERHVDGTELFERVLGERVHLGLGRGVADHRGDRRTVLGQAGLDVAQLGGVDVGQHDAHPLGDQCLGNREADAAGSAGDHCDIAGCDRGRTRR